MTKLFLYGSEPLRVIDVQPDFPAHDLTENNADFLKFLFEDEGGIEGQAKTLREHQRSIYEVAHWALRACGYPAQNSEAEFYAFTRGFATFEAMAMVVKDNGEYATQRAALRAQQLLIDPGDMADFELAERHKSWPDARPNIYSTVISIASKQEESLNELRAREIGAHVAYELQRPLLDIA